MDSIFAYLQQNTEPRLRIYNKEWLNPLTLVSNTKDTSITSTKGAGMQVGTIQYSLGNLIFFWFSNSVSKICFEIGKCVTNDTNCSMHVWMCFKINAWESCKMRDTWQACKRKSARDPKNLCILPENSAEDLGSRRVLLVLRIYLWECTPKLLHLPPKSCHNFT